MKTEIKIAAWIALSTFVLLIVAYLYVPIVWLLAGVGFATGLRYLNLKPRNGTDRDIQ